MSGSKERLVETDSSGQCRVKEAGLNAADLVSVTFTVVDVSDGGLPYISGANHDPDGDSTGTEITVLSPL